jgi:hypothetical protein
MSNEAHTRQNLPTRDSAHLAVLKVSEMSVLLAESRAESIHATRWRVHDSTLATTKLRFVFGARIKVLANYIQFLESSKSAGTTTFNLN